MKLDILLFERDYNALHTESQQAYSNSFIHYFFNGIQLLKGYEAEAKLHAYTYLAHESNTKWQIRHFAWQYYRWWRIYSSNLRLYGKKDRTVKRNFRNIMYNLWHYHMLTRGQQTDNIVLFDCVGTKYIMPPIVDNVVLWHNPQTNLVKDDIVLNYKRDRGAPKLTIGSASTDYKVVIDRYELLHYGRAITSEQLLSMNNLYDGDTDRINTIIYTVASVLRG